MRRYTRSPGMIPGRPFRRIGELVLRNSALGQDSHPSGDWVEAITPTMS